MKPMDLMDALGEVPQDLVNAAVCEEPIAEKKRSHIILSRAVAFTALAASFAVVFGLIHVIGKFSEQSETVQTAEHTAAVTFSNQAEIITTDISNTAYEETVPETTEDPYHSTAKTNAEIVPAETTTFTTATFHVETQTQTLPYIPPHEVEQKDIICWHDCGLRTDGNEAESPYDMHDSITIPALPGFQFTWEKKAIAVSKDGRQIAAFDGMPIWSAYFTDLTSDGIPELCMNSSFGRGMVDEHITVYDCMERKQYDLWDRGIFDYKLSVENDSLTVERTLNRYNTAESTLKGRIVLKDGVAYFVESGKQLDTALPPITEYKEGSVLTWFDFTQDTNETLRFRISAYPDIVFTYENEMLYFEQDNHKNSIAFGSTWNAFFTDLTGDGKPEICATKRLHSSLDSIRPAEVIVMDISKMHNGHLIYFQNDQDGTLCDTDTEFDYVLYVENGELFVNKNSWHSAWDPFSKHGTKGKLRFEDNLLIFDEVK
ncbi:MAG: hypothetical protein IK130_01140 [Oscillospiraceae bacterium]|nr:hypothetical protein [Oscillospiraceae bacterium]